MKIAYYSPAWPAAEAQNGIATYVEILTRALERAGHEWVVVTPKILSGATSDRVIQVVRQKPRMIDALSARIQKQLEGPHYFSLSAAANDVACAFEVANKNGPVDLIEIEESFGYEPYLRKRLSAPIVTRLHGPHFLVHQDEIEKKDLWRIDAEGKAIKDTLGLSSPSSAVIESVKNFYGAAGRIHSAIPNPVEIASPQESWHVEKCDRNMILFVGRFDNVKGADIMLNAFIRLASRYKDLKLVMIGKETGLRVSAGKTLGFEDYAAAFVPDELLSRITYLGPVSRAEANRLRREAFACVSASRFECFPYAVTEALALGCPVVATGTDGLTEHLKAGEDFLLAQKEDAASLADGIAALLDDPALAEKIASSGQRTAAARLSPEEVADMAIAFYQRVIDSAGGG